MFSSSQSLLPYTKIKTLQSGAFGTVYLCKRKEQWKYDGLKGFKDQNNLKNNQSNRENSNRTTNQGSIKSQPQFVLINNHSDNVDPNKSQHSNINPLPPLFATKQLFGSSQLIMRQLDLLKHLPSNHPNIVKPFFICKGPFINSIGMELGTFDLSSWIKGGQYPIQWAGGLKGVSQGILRWKCIARDLINGLTALKSQSHVLHRDIKPGNVMIIVQDMNGQEQGQRRISRSLRNWRAAICDFGSAIKQQKCYQIEGFTRWYKAPQLFFGSNNYSYEIDIWSVGVTLFELAAGSPLFPGQSDLQQLVMMTKILGDPSQTNWPSVNLLPDSDKIIFKPIAPKTPQEISRMYCIPVEMCRLLLKMIRYDQRSTTDELLKDTYLNDINPEEEAQLKMNPQRLSTMRLNIIQKHQKGQSKGDGGVPVRNQSEDQDPL